MLHLLDPAEDHPLPHGLVDKGTRSKRARFVPLIAEVRELVQHRIDVVEGRPDARLFTGPRGGRITTAVFRDATHWDEVVASSGSSTCAATDSATPA